MSGHVSRDLGESTSRGRSEFAIPAPIVDEPENGGRPWLQPILSRAVDAHFEPNSTRAAPFPHHCIIAAAHCDQIDYASRRRVTALKRDLRAPPGYASSC